MLERSLRASHQLAMICRIDERLMVRVALRCLDHVGGVKGMTLRGLCSRVRMG